MQRVLHNLQRLVDQLELDSTMVPTGDQADPL
jgi:hypothetical protein